MFGLFDFFFSNQKKKAFLDGTIYGQGKVITEQRSIKIATLEASVGKVVICVSNEWENPVVGKLLRYDQYGRVFEASPASYFPIVEDYVSGEIRHCGGVQIPYSEEMVRVLVDKMTPYERWGVLTRTNIRQFGTVPLYPDQYKPLLTAQEIINKVKLQGK